MRKALVMMAVAAAALLLAAGEQPSAQKAPLKIGLVVPQTGRVAANGKEVINGLELFLEEQKHRLGGREIKPALPFLLVTVAGGGRPAPPRPPAA
jgi:branched-chain amino acid transport system substrate-binding protein